jgi:hypothetical protein
MGEGEAAGVAVAAGILDIFEDSMLFTCLCRGARKAITMDEGRSKSTGGKKPL